MIITIDTSRTQLVLPAKQARMFIMSTLTIVVPSPNIPIPKVSTFIKSFLHSFHTGFEACKCVICIASMNKHILEERRFW
jgi:hypothetical protein